MSALIDTSHRTAPGWTSAFSLLRSLSRSVARSLGRPVRGRLNSGLVFGETATTRWPCLVANATSPIPPPVPQFGGAVLAIDDFIDIQPRSPGNNSLLMPLIS